MTDTIGLRDDVLRDAWPLAGKWDDGRPAGRLVRPAAIAEIPAILREATTAGAVVVAAGARSGVCGALVTSPADIVLDMTGLDRILDLDEEAGVVTVEAGILGGTLERRLAECGFTCGHYPQSLEISTVGGWLSTRGIGTFSNKYGGIENLVVGCEVVLANGETVALGGAPRSAAGPRLIELFLGSEGTFGVVTKVTLRIFKKAQALQFGAYACPSLASGIAAAHDLFSEHAAPALLRLYDAAESRGLYRKAGVAEAEPLLIVAHEGATAMVAAEEALAKAILGRHGARFLGPEVALAWNAERYRAEWLEDGNAGPDRIADSIEVSVTWPGLMPLYERVMAEIAPLTDWSMAHLSHFYPTGSMFYFIFGIEDGDRDSLAARYAAVCRVVGESALALGGTCTHHHGVGAVRQELFRRELGASGHALLRAIKHALDPKGILNPGALGLAERQAQEDGQAGTRQ